MPDVVRKESTQPSLSDEVLRKRLELATFIEQAPADTGIDARELAMHLRIGVSTLWKFVADGLVEKPTKYGAKVSVWTVGYARKLAKNGFGQEVA